MARDRNRKENRPREENRRKELVDQRKKVEDHYKNFIKDDASVISYDEDEMEWRELNKMGSTKEEDTDDHFTVHIPEMVWMIPPHNNCSPFDILGDKRTNLKRIAQLTHSEIEFNEKKNRIEMWGTPEGLEEALRQWDALASSVLERKKRGRSKTWEDWQKADKAPLNEKQRVKMERRRKREEEENKYKEITEDPHPFNNFFIIPNTDIPIERFIGKKGCILDPVRIKFKCHIWHEPKQSLMKIVGMTSENVEEATLRVKYLFMKVFAYKSIPTNGWVHHLVEPLNEPHKVRITVPPSWFRNPSYDDSEFRLLKPITEIDKAKEIFDLKIVEKIRESNLKKICDAVIKSLENIHLLDDEIKMRIRFGHVCLTRFPQPKETKEKDGSSVWSFNKFHEKVISNPRILSKFSTCLATDDKQLHDLFEELTDSRFEDSQKLDGSPFREFKIRASRKIPESDESWSCVFDVNFEKFRCDEKKGEKKKDLKMTDRKYDGRIGLWNSVLTEKDVLNISTICLDGDYSWKLNIQTARRLSNDKFGAQGNFIYKLRFCPEGRLVYSNTKEVNVISVCEKTKWKYWWRKDYIVEITRYEFWDLSKYQQTLPGIEIPLSKESPPIVSYGVTFYKKSWDEEFSFNGNLEAGEVPEWHPHDIIDEEKTSDLFVDIKRFMKILQTNLKAMPNQY